MTQTFNLYLQTEDGDDEILIGKAQIDGKGQLTLLEAETEHESFIENIFSDVNKQEPIVMLTPPPAQSKSSSGTFSKPISRADADFLPNLQKYLQTYFGLILS